MIIQGKVPGTEQIMNVSVEGGILQSIEPATQNTRYDRGGPEVYLSQGFFDPQINGYSGIDFNRKDLTVERLHQAACSLAASGITRFLPTLITASHERLVHQLRIIGEALEHDLLLFRMVPGVHLEGPYLSPEDGPRGVHPRDCIRRPDWDEVERLQEACRGRIRCVTLAPEIEGAIPFIEKAVEKGMIIGLGHTHASDEVLEDALHAGARLSCHLGNAAHAVLARQHNPIEKQLSMDGLMASFIVDGIHLPGHVVKNYVRAKGIDRVLLTTDAMAGAGAIPGRYTLGDLEVEVKAGDRSARWVGKGRLAGSTLTMDQAVTNVIRFAGVNLAEALRMANRNGSTLFPEVKREILPGRGADIVLFEYREEIKVTSTWIGGEQIERPFRHEHTGGPKGYF
jgi:N-acetylglucosamine-6-phosphate deacetylase